jgi:sulfite reductase alpha subunit-like flavoprotein
VIFVMATYGEGEPTDNAVGLMEFLKNDEVTFSEGGNRLDGMKYTVFALGNRTYEVCRHQVAKLIVVIPWNQTCLTALLRHWKNH